MQCEGNCDPDSACAAPVFPSRPPLPPYKLEPLPLPDDVGPEPSASDANQAASAALVAAISAVVGLANVLGVG